MPSPDCPDCGARTGTGYVCPKCEPERLDHVEALREHYHATESRTEALRVPPALQDIDFA
jgi:tRNA(Ile2) C34 agmatinyltransferase TiaS